MSSGIVRIRRNPLTAETIASPTPVLPLVGSTIVEPARMRPWRSASSSMATAMRSFTLPPGFSDSTFATTSAPPGLGSRFKRTSGVRPTSSSTDAAIFPRSVISGLARSYVIHRTRHAASLRGAHGEIAEGQAVDHAGHRLGNLLPEIHEVLPIAHVAIAIDHLERRRRSFHGAQHVTDRDVVRTPREMVAARRATLRRQEPGAL